MSSTSITSFLYLVVQPITPIAYCVSPSPHSLFTESTSLQSTLLTLLKSSYILPFHPSQLVSPRDKLITWRKEELKSITGGLVNQTAQKERNSAYERAKKRVDEERAEWSDVRRAIKKTG